LRNGCGALLHDHFAVTKEDGAGAALCLSEAAAKLGDVGIGVHDVSFDRLHARLVVPTVVERHPKTLELRGPRDQRPSDPIRHVSSMILGSGRG
jgi:hypothetical protein